MSHVDEATLPASFRKGLEVIRSRHRPDATILAVADNFAYIGLGPEDGLEDRFTIASTHLVARAPLTFPSAAPYGVVTTVLHRKDGKALERFHPGHPYCTVVAKALGTTELAFWSWDWNRMPLRAAEDMGHIVEWARKCLRLNN